MTHSDFGINGNLGGGCQEKQMSEMWEFNIEIAQDVIELLHKVKFKKYIVLENFHYLTDETQRAFSIDLRVFQDSGIRFIILGIGKEKNRLLQFNRDLLDRICEIPVEPWVSKDFKEVIKLGEHYLNISIAEEIKEKILENSFGNIGIVQELCKYVCLFSGVNKNSVVKKNILLKEVLEKALEQKAEDYRASHIRSLECIASASLRTRGLYMPYYLIVIIANTDVNELLFGITRSKLLPLFKQYHYRPDDVRSSDLTYLLNNFAELQLKNYINPPLIDYDLVGRKWRVIDATLLYFLKFEDTERLLEDIEIPIEDNQVKIDMDNYTVEV